MQPLQTIAQLQTLVRHKPIVVVEIGSIRCCACSAIAQKLSARYKDDPLVTCASLSLEAAADTCADVMGLLRRMSTAFHQTLVMITHNSEIAQLADRIVRIEDGRIVERG
jgi:predicted ABC-type transport system involved in lysophospholipase L1 biosynthesis ATPase subunit